MEERLISFYTADDWVWVFADGECIFSDHSITGQQLLEALDYGDFFTYSVKPGTNEEALWSIGHEGSVIDDFPEDLFE